MSRALALVVVLALALPARAQPIDAPTIPNVLACPPGLVCLAPDVAVATAKRLASAEAKLEVYEQHPPFKWWVILLIGVISAGVGAAITVPIVTGHCAKNGC